MATVIVHQFRLVANDFEGTEWACGWTFPKLKGMSKTGWLLTGDLHSLLTRAEGPWVSKEAGVEIVYHPKLALPMDKPMLSVTSVAGEEIARRWSDGQKNGSDARHDVSECGGRPREFAHES